MALRLNYNPVAKRTQEQKAALPDDVQQRLKSWEDAGQKRSCLKRLKKNESSVKVGDIFLVGLREHPNVLFYGRVLHIISAPQKLDWLNGECIAFIFKCHTKTKTLDNLIIDYDNVICGPEILSTVFWEKGNLETIGNIHLTKEEKQLDMGFWNNDIIGKGGQFVDKHLKPMNHFPKYFQWRALCTYDGITYHLKKAIIIDPSLAEE